MHGAEAPSPWVTRFAHLIAAGAQVLDVACGAGRHTMLLPRAACSVDAVDRDAGLATFFSGQANVRFLPADIEAGAWPYAGRQFDAVIVTNYLHRPLLPVLRDAVAENGVLIYETFARGNEAFGKPSNPAFLLQPLELLDAFAQGFSSSLTRKVWWRRRGARAYNGCARCGGARGKWRNWTAAQAAHAGRIAAFRVKPFRDDQRKGHEKMIKGSLVAIVTPMQEDGTLDLDAYRRLIEWHIAEGTHGIVAVGTTGESPTVDFDEHNELIRTAVETARKRVPVIAGTGGNSTAEAIELTRYAKKVGADATLQVVPYYNKPSQEGMFQHFKTIAETVDLPVILYNVPSRTVADMATDTTLRLAAVPGIVGIKDATGDLARGADLLRRAPKQFAVYSGNDDSALALMLVGGHGVISVTANVTPRLMSELARAALDGNLARAREINNQLLPLHFKLFVEPNPTAVKWALQRIGRTGGGIRLPLVPLGTAAQQIVEAALKEAGVLG